MRIERLVYKAACMDQSGSGFHQRASVKREQLVELARLCANQARATSAKDVAATLWRMAQEYQQKAARLDSGKLPDIGEKPSDV
jgi:hypothetical protein